MHAKLLVKATLAIVTGLTVGCMTRTKIESRRAAPFKDPLSELFVMSQVGEDHEISAAKFEAELTRYGRECHLRLGITTISRLDLDPAIHEQRKKDFGARQLLAVKLTGGTKDAAGGIVMATYDAQLSEATSTQLLWRADVQLYLNGVDEPSYTLARDLLRALEADGAIRACPSLHAPAENEVPRRR